MKLFGQLVRTAVNVALLPAALVKDAVTMGGALIDDKPEIAKALERLKREADEAPR